MSLWCCHCLALTSKFASTRAGAFTFFLLLNSTMKVNRQPVAPALDMAKRMELAQEALKGQFAEDDQLGFRWSNPNERAKPDLTRIAGFSVIDAHEGRTSIFSLVITSYPAFDVLYASSLPTEISTPRIPGYEGFREAGPFMELLNRVLQNHPGLAPQLLVVHGRGKYDHRGFGLACHLGVLSGLPAVAVSREWVEMDGLSYDQVHAYLQDGAEAVALLGRSNVLWGMAYVPPSEVDTTRKTIYVSVGNKVSMETATELVKALCITDMPEPILKAEGAGNAALAPKNGTVYPQAQDVANDLGGTAAPAPDEGTAPTTERRCRPLPPADSGMRAPRRSFSLADSPARCQPEAAAAQPQSPGSPAGSPGRERTSAAAAAHQRAAQAYQKAQAARAQQPLAEKDGADTKTLQVAKECEALEEESKHKMANGALNDQIVKEDTNREACGLAKGKPETTAGGRCAGDARAPRAPVRLAQKLRTAPSRFTPTPTGSPSASVTRSPSPSLSSTSYGSPSPSLIPTSYRSSSPSVPSTLYRSPSPSPMPSSYRPLSPSVPSAPYQSPSPLLVPRSPQLPPPGQVRYPSPMLPAQQLFPPMVQPMYNQSALVQQPMYTHSTMLHPVFGQRR